MIHYFIYSISLMAFWGLLLLDINKPGLLGVFIGLTYTFYSSFLIRFFVKEENRKLIFIKFIGPVFYLLVGFYVASSSAYHLLHPIYIAFLLFCIASFYKDFVPKKEVQFFVVAFIYLYSFSLYNIWDKEANRRVQANRYDFELSESSEAGQDKIPNLSHYQFLNSNLDSINLSGTNEYVIIETWNEKCPPCFRAMIGMADFYEKIKEKANQYYVYIPARKKRKLDYKKIFSFDKIADKSCILVDVNLQKDALLEQYPVFLVFDKKGELVYKQIGYKGFISRKIEEGILSVLD